MFCTGCADKFVPLPEQQLFEPVRVCNHCLKNRQSKDSDQDAADVLAANMQPAVAPDSSSSAKHANHEQASDPLSAKSRTDSHGSDIDILVPHVPSKPIPVKNPSTVSGRSGYSNTASKEELMGSWQQNTMSSPRLNPELSSSQVSLHSNSSLVFEGRNCQKTCSQESVNVESSADGQRMLGARAEC